METILPMETTQVHTPASLVTLAQASIRRADQPTPLLQIDQLTITPGDRITLTGASGSGKSLLLSLLAGTTSPALTLDGKIQRNYQRCAVIPQRGIEALHPLKKISKQLKDVTGKSLPEVQATLRKVSLDPDQVGRRRPAEISGGQAQRVAIALAVLSEAQLILADEPTSALDQETRDQTLSLLLGVITPEQALVLTTHDTEVSQRMIGRRITVAQGRIQEEEAKAGSA